MLQLHYWPTPNGHKITLLLEEVAEQGHPLDYIIKPLDIGAGAQFDPAFLKTSPNNKMPAIIDPEPADGGAPLSVFESGAILLYLAEKTGLCLPTDPRGRIKTLQWVFWQMGGLGPMTGQYGHFGVYAPERIAYAIDRYSRETARLLWVLDRHLAECEFINDDAYSIADMACYPWINPYEKLQTDLGTLPNLQRWHQAIAARPSTQRAYALGRGVNPSTGAPLGEEERKQLFGQGAH